MGIIVILSETKRKEEYCNKAMSLIFLGMLFSHTVAIFTYAVGDL